MKATQALFGSLQRLPLTPKQVGKGYYKGNGVGHLGKWDSYNPRVFKVDYSKVRTFVYPIKGLEGFHLTPFVAKTTPIFKTDQNSKYVLPQKKLTGAEYLKKWKEDGDHSGAEYE